LLRCRTLFLFLALLSLAGAAPVSATTVTVQITGTWDSVTDTASVTDGSVTGGTSFTATLVFDDSTPDADGTVNVGDYTLAAAATSLDLSTGSYTFSLLASSSISLGIDDNVGGQDAFGFFTEFFSTTGLLSGGATTGYGFANPSFFDSSETAHTSDDLTDLPWDASLYDLTNFYFLIEVDGVGSGEFIELSGEVDGLQVLPEPSLLLLLALSGGMLAVRRG
jgi:hypothetical protein